jgi:hypothetical protein
MAAWQDRIPSVTIVSARPWRFKTFFSNAKAAALSRSFVM